LICVAPAPDVVKLRPGTELAKSRNWVAASASRFFDESAVTDSGVSLSFCSCFWAVTTISSSSLTAAKTDPADSEAVVVTAARARQRRML
jgi:hypothetical protein